MRPPFFLARFSLRLNGDRQIVELFELRRSLRVRRSSNKHKFHCTFLCFQGSHKRGQLGHYTTPYAAETATSRELPTRAHKQHCALRLTRAARGAANLLPCRKVFPKLLEQLTMDALLVGHRGATPHRLRRFRVFVCNLVASSS